MAAAIEGAFAWSSMLPYVVAQLLGAFTGVMVANVLGVSCTAKARVPKPERRGGCRQ
jgi:glycerol uptake facilitator-like aquaporin